MIEDIKLKDFCKETKELFKRLPKVKQCIEEKLNNNS